MVLNDGQYKIYKEALAWFKSSSSPQVFEIDGLAGTGKSFLMHHILRGLNLREEEYLPMAYTGQAAIVMRTRGFRTARSIHSTLYHVVEVYDEDDINTKYNRPKKKLKFVRIESLPPEVKLIFIDEAYMVPERMVKEILRFRVKVIVCGDQHQLPPIGGNPGFLTGPNVHHLTQLMRQDADNPIVYLANRIINGQPINYGIYGNSVYVIHKRDFIDQMLGYAQIILTATNKTRDYYNNYVRNLMGFKSDFPFFGERLICRNNNWNIVYDGIALANGLCGTCVKPPDPSLSTYDTFNIAFKPDILNVAFENLDINTQYFLGDYYSRMEIKSNSKYNINGELFEYAYAITTHLSQGGEFDHGIIVLEPFRSSQQRQLDYTAITRFKKSCIILVSEDY